MTTITIEKISKITFQKQKKDIEDMTLLEYINSDEYKNEDRKYYTNSQDFLSDLKKGI